MTSVQQDFIGGINQFRFDTKLADNEYILGENLRARDATLSGIKGVTEYAIDDAHWDKTVVGLPANLFTDYDFRILKVFSFKGTVYAVVAFFLKNESLGASAFACIVKLSTPVGTHLWTWMISIAIVTGVSSSTLIPFWEECYVLEIPEGFETTARTGNGPKSAPTYGVLLNDQSPSGVLVTINVPIGFGLSTSQVALIDSGGVPLTVNNSPSLWNKTTNREYVPTGCRGLAYLDGILFWVSSDGLRIFRSVQGRPLDFVVNINNAGDMGSTSPAVEETTAYAVSANPITCIRALTTGQLFVATRYESYFVTLNYDDLIFGEVTFNKSPAFKTGVVNQDCLVELPDDLALIAPDGGIRSFNAVMQNKWRGRNSVFSLKIDKILSKISQASLSNGWYEHPSCVVFDNYAFFSVRTLYGMSVMVYDTLTQAWVSRDSYWSDTQTAAWIDKYSQIRNFAVADLTTEFELWGQTGYSVYKLLSSNTLLSCVVYPRAVCTQQPSAKGKLKAVYCIFEDGTDADLITLTEYVDGKVGESLVEKLQILPGGISYPVGYPVLWNTTRTLNDVRFNFDLSGNRGWVFQIKLKWPGKAKLAYLEMLVEDSTEKIGVLQAIAPYR